MKSPVVYVGLLLTLACSLLYIYEPQLVRVLSHKAYDTLIKYQQQPPKTDLVAIVDLDEKSLATHGQWPWPRYLVGELTEKLFEAGVEVVAFDMVFAEQDRTSPHRMLSDMKNHFNIEVDDSPIPHRLMDYDQVFAKALENKKVVLGCYMHQEKTQDVNGTQDDPYYQGWFYSKGHGDIAENLFKADYATFSLPVLREQGGKSAFFNFTPLYDNIVRSAPLVWAHGDQRIYPSLALEAYRLYKDIPQVGIHYDQGINELQLGSTRIPTDSLGHLLINFRSVKHKNAQGVDTTFPTYSAADIMAGTIKEQNLQNRIVFIGTSAAGLKDMRATPITEVFSGVEIHATVVDNMIAGDFLKTLKWDRVIDLLSIMFIGGILTMVVQRKRAWLSFMVASATILFAITMSMFLFQNYNIVFTPVRLIISVFIMYPILTMVSFWVHERKERWIRTQFQTMVSSKVLRFLEDNPDNITQSGKKTEATILFSDVQGFSSIAEQLDPVALTHLLNDYLSPMTQIVMEEDGYVDKYVGDMIMAVWGVPYFMERHALQACEAALRQVEDLKKLQPVLKEQYGHEIHMRIGINSGLVTAGKMGTAQRNQYTVIGDEVNLASRLEPLNKEFGTTVLLGENTHQAVKDHFETRLLDHVLVSGKSIPVNVYELVARKHALSATHLQAIRLYEQALQHHRSKEWKSAEAEIKAVLNLTPEDDAAVRLQQIIQKCRSLNITPSPAQKFSKSGDMVA